MVDIFWLSCDWVGVKKEGKRRRKKEKTRKNRDVESPCRPCVPRAAGTEGTSPKRSKWQVIFPRRLLGVSK